MISTNTRQIYLTVDRAVLTNKQIYYYYHAYDAADIIKSQHRKNMHCMRKFVHVDLVMFCRSHLHIKHSPPQPRLHIFLYNDYILLPLLTDPQLLVTFDNHTWVVPQGHHSLVPKRAMRWFLVSKRKRSGRESYLPRQ